MKEIKKIILNDIQNENESDSNEYPVIDINKNMKIRVVFKKRIKTAQQNEYFKECNNEYNEYNDIVRKIYFKQYDS